jgi:hypothetical protein
MLTNSRLPNDFRGLSGVNLRILHVGANIQEIPAFLALEDAVMQREQDSATPWLWPWM